MPRPAPLRLQHESNHDMAGLVLNRDTGDKSLLTAEVKDDVPDGCQNACRRVLTRQVAEPGELLARQ